MKTISKALMVAGIAAALGGAASASDAPSAWDLKADTGYVVDKDGKNMMIKVDTMNKDAMAKATRVPNGTVFFMHDGHLMMMNFDR
jgi:hypothetical protein